ncbi:MAG TPA: Ger(x)C family spore germination protein, partial [Paenibacillus sp.]
MIRRVVVSLVMGCTLFCTTGCWDRVEIDERGFVVGVGIDIPDEQEQGAAEEGNGFAERDYLVTYQLVVPSRLKRAGSSGSSDQSYFNITLRGDT